MKARDCIDQLRGDADGVRGAPHTAFEHCAHVQFVRDRADVGVRTLKRERRGARGHLQPVDRGERVEELLREPVGEVLLLLIPTHVRKGQHGDRVRRGVEGATLREDESVDCEITTSTAIVSKSTAFERKNAGTGFGAIGAAITRAAARTAPVGSCDSSGDTKRLIRSTKAGGVSPPGRRVHCTCRKRSGTSARESLVSSMTTGTRNATRSDMSAVRSTASFHSRRKYPS